MRASSHCTSMTEPLPKTPEDEPAHTTCPAVLVQQCSKALAATTAGILIAAFLVVDFLTSRQMATGRDGSEWLIIPLMGICIGQMNLIAVWASLAPGNIVLRVSWSLLLTVATWYGFILGRHGTRFASDCMTRADAILLILILLAGVAILQIPLWIAKKAFRWRLTRRPDDTAASLQEDRQFNLQHLLIAMFLLSIALSPLHQILPPGTVDSLSQHRQMHILFPVLILCNLVIAIPCVWWAFLSTAAFIQLVFGWLLYCAVITAIEFGCLCAILGPPPRQESMEAVFFFYLLNLSQCIAVLATLRIIRALGFRMVRTPRQPIAPSP